MTARTIVLRTLLTMLLLAATLGVMSIFSATDLAGRAAASAVVLAVASALSLQWTPKDAASRIDMLRGCAIGYLAIASVLAIGAIWESVGDRIAQLMLFWLVNGVAALALATPALQQRRSTDRSLELAERISIYGSMLAVAVGFATATVATAGGGPRIELAYLWCVAIACGAGVAAAAATGMRGIATTRRPLFAPPKSRDRKLGVIGIAASVLAVIAFMLAALASVRRDPSERFVQLGLACTMLAAPIGVWNFFGLVRAGLELSILRPLSVMLVAVFVGLWTAMAFREDGIDPSRDAMFGRLALACGILTFTSLLTAAIMFRLRRAKPIALDPIETFVWKCPRCSAESEFVVATGRVSCASCGLGARVALCDDRCPACSYDLRGLPADATNCPECGRERQMPAAT
ncbi:MAG: zinc ribbon domain-containing protein [Phycisphaerales bacterium]